MFKGGFIIFCIVAAVGLGYLGASVYRQMKDLPDITIVERYEPIEAIQLFDKNDHLVCTVEGDEDRRVIPLNQVSTHMQQAILAAEDHHFYEHQGINIMSIGRAALANLQAGKVVEGASTITQQLVKNLFFTDAQRTFDRKIKEAYMAYELEQRYAKERILEMYLNQVYFGNNAYGVERAASRYFDKTAATLDIAQAAFLAGIVKAPSQLGSKENRAAGFARQKEIIDKMHEYGYITAAQAKAAKAEKLSFKQGINPLQKYPYYVAYVLEQLRDRFSQAEMRRQGLRVYTNLDPKAQEIAEKVLTDSIKKAPKGVTQGALVSVAVQDGSVVAMVGGVGNFWKHQFNRATNPHTAGSSFKPFVYLSAFIKDVVHPDSSIDDTPLVVKQPWGLPDYAPKNFDRKFMGKINIRKALAMSRNVPAVKVAQMTGMESIVETARLAGITTKLDPNLSLALGSSAVTPLDMAGAYTTFCRGGISIKPQVLRKIENNRGQVIEVFQNRVDKVFPMEPVAQLVSVLQDVVKYGTGTGAKLEDRPVAGKTGTADEAKDIWFIGFTPDMCTAVWGGNDDNLPIPGQNVTGGVVMAKIWKEYNKQYYLAHPTPAGTFITPSEIQGDKDKEKMAKEGGNDNSILPQVFTPLENAIMNRNNKEGTPDTAAESTQKADEEADKRIDSKTAETAPDSGTKEKEKEKEAEAPKPAPDYTPLTPPVAPPITPSAKTDEKKTPEAGTPPVAPPIEQHKSERRLLPVEPRSAFRPGMPANPAAPQSRTAAQQEASTGLPH